MNGKLFKCLAFLVCILSGCNHHHVHKLVFYGKMNKKEAHKEGYHANEAKRLLDYNEITKETNQEQAKEGQEKLSSDLNQLNKPNKYNSKPQKAKKKRFGFYM